MNIPEAHEVTVIKPAASVGFADGKFYSIDGQTGLWRRLQRARRELARRRGESDDQYMWAANAHVGNAAKPVVREYVRFVEFHVLAQHLGYVLPEKADVVDPPLTGTGGDR